MNLREEIVHEMTNAPTEQLVSALYKPVFSSKDMPLTSRVINHWHENDVFLYKNEAGKWRKFSAADYIWVLLCNRLRALNVGLKTIQNVRNQCVASSFHLVAMGIEMELNTKAPGEESQELLALLHEIKKSGVDVLKEELAQPPFQMFSFFLTHCLSNNEDVLLKIAPNEGNRVDFVILRKGEVHAERLLQTIASEGGIVISLQSLLNEFYDSKRFNWEEVVPLQLTQEERKVLAFIREKRFEKVTVHMVNQKPSRVSLKSQKKKMLRQEFDNACLNGNFKNIKLITMEGEQVLVEVEQSVKL